jgi:hypothetical protein
VGCFHCVGGYFFEDKFTHDYHYAYAECSPYIKQCWGLHSQSVELQFPCGARPVGHFTQVIAAHLAHSRVMPSLVAALFFFGVVSLLCLLVYRLWLSPLAKFPGPKLAAATLWYETYYDVFCWGRYGFEIAKMHEKNGMLLQVDAQAPEFLPTQGRSCALAPTSSMSTIPTFMRFCTRETAHGTNMSISPDNSASRGRWPRPWTITATASYAQT